jgi:nicotinate-nucleotide adenylyltransferase
LSVARIAIFGGAFDPPHLAHLFTVTWLLGLPEVDAVWVLPTADHVFGKKMTPFEQRVAWLNSALKPFDSARVAVCTLEAERSGPSRTFDTLEALVAAHPEHHFSLVMGADNLAERDRWHRFDELVQRWPILAVGRSGSEGALEASVSAGWCTAGPTMPDVSSTAVRSAARLGDEPGLRWVPGSLRASVQRQFAEAGVAEGLPRVLVLGHGQAGAALGAALRAAGVVVTTWDRRDDRGADASGSPAELLASHGAWILAVGDPALPEVAESLSKQWLAAATGPGAARPVALHLAGRLGAEVLAPLALVGVHTGSLHPLQSLRGAESAGALRGCYCAVEGDAEATVVATSLVRAFGGRPVQVPEGGKAIWHASAVLAGNFATVLGAGGVDLLGTLGIAEPEARALLTPLLRGTVEQFGRVPAAESLTGPLARGDLDAVAAHIKAIAAVAPEWQAVYAAMARAAARMRGWSAEQQDRLAGILGG